MNGKKRVMVRPVKQGNMAAFMYGKRKMGRSEILRFFAGAGGFGRVMEIG